ncbi:glutaredoxin family protein [Psychrobacillus sp. FSL K6-2684]|uniref:Glutaredoxin family protein n=1 Tax=Psychrobacillus faecigallinarum TaxID=2762235 RepID=A0ABR8RD32_9BACI|nr:MULTISPECIES: glutaredoxin family protein [Psychrobacillus]MBD7945673.1 glutaredoxin family protein [Psychrobacillus faecigallinarum]QEY22419.1 glutaredoxin family protein [Psychrobacillus sp. AK 1817]
MLVHFYTRPGCHLCDDARMMLKLVQEDVPFQIEEHNIEEDDQLHEKYMLMIPVVEYQGEIIQYGNVDYVTLMEALEN